MATFDISQEMNTIQQQLTAIQTKVSETCVHKPDDDLSKINTNTSSTENSGSNGGFFSGGDFEPVKTTTTLPTGQYGGKSRRKHHKKARHSRKSKGLKNRLKKLFGFRGGIPPLENPKGGSGTTVKYPI